MSYTFSRRAFLKYSATTAVAVAGAGLLGGCEYQDPQQPGQQGAAQHDHQQTAGHCQPEYHEDRRRNLYFGGGDPVCSCKPDPADNRLFFRCC